MDESYNPRWALIALVLGIFLNYHFFKHFFGEGDLMISAKLRNIIGYHLKNEAADHQHFRELLKEEPSLLATAIYQRYSIFDELQDRDKEDLLMNALKMSDKQFKMSLQTSRPNN